MPFNEKTTLRDERTPLIQNPIIWTRSNEYVLEAGDHSDYSYARSKKKEQFQWIVFIGVTIISFFILLAIIGAAMAADERLPPVLPSLIVSTTPVPSTTGIPITAASITTTTTTTTPIPPVLNDESDAIVNPVNTNIQLP